MPVIVEHPARFHIPHLEVGSRPEQKFARVVTGGIDAALGVIEQNFEHPVSAENTLAYHNRIHTLGAIWRTGTILREIQQEHPELVSDRDILLGEFIAAWHDSVQNWSTDGTKRIRAFGPNEIASMKLAFSYMRQANDEMGEEVFTVSDMRTVRDAILLTTPNFDKQIGTVIQPGFKNYSNNLIVQAVALADLGGTGMEGFATAIWTTDALFLEENMDIAAYINNYSAQGSSHRRLEKNYRDRLDSWYTSQQEFSTARRKQLKHEIDEGMDERVRGAVWSVFGKDESVVAQLAQHQEKCRQMSFPELVVHIKEVLNNPPVYDLSVFPELHNGTIDLSQFSASHSIV